MIFMIFWLMYFFFQVNWWHILVYLFLAKVSKIWLLKSNDNSTTAVMRQDILQWNKKAIIKDDCILNIKIHKFIQN